MNEENESLQVQNETDYTEIIETVTSGTQAYITAVQDFNTNFISGTLGIVACLGFVFGALLGMVYDRIFRK